MSDRFKSMTRLLASLPPQGNYDLQCDASRETRVKLFAPHGGCIEPSTGNLVRRIAHGATDYYVFQGTRKRNCFDTLHVTSSRYDEPACLAMARSALVAVAIHGCEGRASFIAIGGGNARLADDLIEHLQQQELPAQRPADGMQGRGSENFVNLAQRGGVQLELSVGFRKTLFADYPKCLHGNPIGIGRFVAAMRSWIRGIEERLV